MTHEELSQIYYLKKEIKLIDERLEELQTRATKVTSTISTEPTGSKNFTGAGFENDIDKRIELQDKLADLQQRVNIEALRVQDYIYNVNDSLVRMIITLRCINCYSWNKIAMIMDDDKTADSVRMTYYRYLKNH